MSETTKYRVTPKDPRTHAGVRIEGTGIWIEVHTIKLSEDSQQIAERIARLLTEEDEKRKTYDHRH